MRLAIVFLLAATACGKYSEAEVGRLEQKAGDRNARRYDEALAAALGSHDLTELKDAPWAITPITQVRVADGAPVDVASLSEPETLAKEVLPDGSDGHTVLVIASQCGGNSCECIHDTEYHFATDHAGAIYLVRMHVERHTRTVHQEGACGYGCGVPTPPEPSQIYALPGAFGGFVDGKVVREEIAVTCDQMIPAP